MCAAMTDTSGGFDQFLDQFKTQTAGHVKHLTTLALQFSELARQYDDVRRDLESERLARRHSQESAEVLAGRVKDLEESTMHGAFVLLVVDADADAYMFDDKYYTSDPAEGGKRACHDLKVATQKYLKSVDSRLAELPIMARAFASGEGLANLVTKAGVATPNESQQFVSRFTCGFTQADDMFDFVLVGKGKDRADHKLMGIFRQFVEVPSCQHILLACCHDNGYVRLLEKYVDSPTVVKKVTMVKSFQTGHEFAGLGSFSSTTMETIFRNRPIVVGGMAPEGGPLTSNGSMKRSNSPTMGTYATRAAASQTSVVLSASKSRPPPMFGPLDKTAMLINASGHRIDMPLPQRSAAAIESFNRKIKQKRFCNKFHLHGTCPYEPDSCDYAHDPLTPAEKLVMRYALRRQMCSYRGDCRDPLCFYGHHCMCSGAGSNCKFPLSLHGVDVNSWREVEAPSGAC
ncbi:hypothetical protein C7999DRAFT_14664 [Corynascus novoguineensis]|uniref:C3H1-type domain-containing protein n=1 Tax=Corynascus novoguineensis TaxID=1126955 RepID=A0AAN7HIV8_9PEZI|nr:hypothetical protein C7999DRAFT_14664 [Corynascus novoguineensis]